MPFRLLALGAWVKKWQDGLRVDWGLGCARRLRRAEGRRVRANVKGLVRRGSQTEKRKEMRS